MIHTIGPVWDGNEVWLLVAGGATFAAFPEWYATLFSGFYLALFLILIALIVRGVAFEFWGKDDGCALARASGSGRHRSAARCPRCCGASAGRTSSHGVPIDAQRRVHRHAVRPAQPVRAARRRRDADVFLAHGAIFLSLRTRGDLEARALRHRRAARRRPRPWPVVAFLLWTIARQSDGGGVEALSAVLAVGRRRVRGVACRVLRRRALAAFAADRRRDRAPSSRRCSPTCSPTRWSRARVTRST